MFDVGALDWNGIFGGLISFYVVFYVQQQQRLMRTRGTQLSAIAFAALVAYIWAPFGFPNSEWARATRNRCDSSHSTRTVRLGAP